MAGDWRSRCRWPNLGGPSPAPPPDPDAFGALLVPSKPRHGALRQLHAALCAFEPEAPAADRVAALEGLFKWMRSTRSVPAPERALPGERAPILRVRLLCRALEQVPVFRERLAATIRATLADSRGAPLFARVGLPSERGLWAETSDRLSRRMLPDVRDDRELVQVFWRLLPGGRELASASALQTELIAELIERLDAAWQPLVQIRSDAIALLATRISAVGLTDVIRARSPEMALDESPFFRLPRATDVLRQLVAAGAGDVAQAIAQCRTLCADCRAVSRAVVENLETSGVSVDVVYRIELLGKSLDRLERLLASFEPAPPLERALRVKELLVELLQARVRDLSLREIFRDNLHLLARKIIERAGHTGEHYITSSRREYFKMLLSAGGGGILTTGTAALKFVVGWLKAAPFVEGVLSSINYAGSFVAMQLVGFTLATKQPSVTAAALAGTLRETAGHPDLGPLVTLIARITRSQLAAAIGNVGMVIPATLLFEFFWRRSHGGEPFLDAETARYALGSLHPTRTGTIFYAALTGVLLWSSSVGAGWLENWAVYRKLPEAIAHHPLGRFVGRRTMGALSRFFARNVSGFGGNVTLGVLLAMTPIFGKFFGSEAALGEIAAAGLGIAIIGSLNFGVSFALALAVALRARQVERSDRWRLLASLFATFFRSPLQFFFPPKDPEHTHVHGPVSIPPPQAH